MGALLRLVSLCLAATAAAQDKSAIIKSLQKELEAARAELAKLKHAPGVHHRRLEESAVWHKTGATSKDCEWVALFPEARCDAKGVMSGGEDKYWAWEACSSCDTRYSVDSADVIVTADGQDCENTACFNRLHPAIPMAATAAPGDIVLFDTPTATCDVKNKSLYEENIENGAFCSGSLHQLAGPLGISGAVAGDKIAITILDVQPTDWGWNHVVNGLGYLSDLPESTYFSWWEPVGDLSRPDGWISSRFPDVEIPFAPFPGLVTVLPDDDIVQSTKERELFVTGRGGSAAPAGTSPDLAFPQAICGEDGNFTEDCVRTIAPGVFYGNEDSQRIAPGNTLIVECFVDECGIGIGDVHGAQGDGEVSITAIEITAHVYVTVDIITPDDPRYVLPSPTLIGASSIKDYSPNEWIAFTGFPSKDAGYTIPQHATYGADLVNMTFVADNLSLAGRNALLACIQFLIDVLDYTFEQALCLASVSVDLRIAQVVDKPALGVEAILPLDIFSGDAYDKVYAAMYGI